MIINIYRLSDGLILRAVHTVPAEVCMQCKEGEEYYLNCPLNATHIIDNLPVLIAPPPPTAYELLVEIRKKRNTLLSQCDWTQMPDSPLTPEQKAAWAAYRQALRDFPATCDPYNPVWPVAPVPT